MQLRTLDELTPEQELGRQLSHASSFEPSSRTDLDYLRRRHVLADYGGIFAVDRGEVVGQTLVFRLPYRFPHGLETLGCIAAVGTRPDRVRQGVARRVLSEVHDRERAAGIDHVGLWTNRSWGAHRLYESLGYRDVYHSLHAAKLRTGKTPPRPSGWRVRSGTRRDLATLEELHQRVTRERWGFTPRPPRALQVDAHLGYFEPKGLRVLLRGSRVEGYAKVNLSPGGVRCGELLATSAPAGEALVRDLERLAGPRLLSLIGCAASDRRDLLARRGFRFLASSWYVFLGASLQRSLRAREAVREFGTADPRWVCFDSDRF